MKKFLTLLLTLIIFGLQANAKDMRFVQISESEFSSSSTNQELKNVINDINKIKDVEFVVFTGDNIIRPAEKELKSFLKTIKKLHAPYYVLIGDKDVNKLKYFGKKEYANTLKKKIFRYKPDDFNYSFEKHGVIFIVVDGAKEVITTTNGYYKAETLDWLDYELTQYKNNNVIILQHFPIIPPEKRGSYVTIKPEKYMEILERHKNVRAIISGHFGVNSEKIINGTTHITTAKVPYYRVIDIIDYESNTPMIWAQLQMAK